MLEPTESIPAGADRARASGIVALREPLPEREIEDVVRTYVRAFERGDVDALVQLVAQEAGPLGRSGGGRAQLIELWRNKIKNLEQRRGAVAEAGRYGQIATYAYDALGVPGAPPRPADMRPGDVYVRVSMITPRMAPSGEQAVGDVLVLLLRREDGQLKIAGQADESANAK